MADRRRARVRCLRKGDEREREGYWEEIRERERKLGALGGASSPRVGNGGEVVELRKWRSVATGGRRPGKFPGNPLSFYFSFSFSPFLFKNCSKVII